MERSLIGATASILGLLGLNGLIIRGQNQKISEKQDIRMCDERHKDLKEDTAEIKKTLKDIQATQNKMMMEIGILNNGRKRVTDGR